MRQILLAAVLGLASAATFAQTVAFGNRLVTVGDPVGKVFEVAGQPSRTVQLQNKFGAGVGERLEYFVGRKTVLITVKGGKVTDVREVF